MTHIDLMRHILVVNTLTRKELALLLNIPEKNINAVLNGEMPLTKKQLKNLSAFTSIPAKVIVSGEFSIDDNITCQNPSKANEQNYNPQQEIMAENFNLQRFKKFIKCRTCFSVKPAMFFGTLAFLIAFIFSCIYGFGFSIVQPFDSVVLHSFTYIFPILITLLCMKKLYKITTNASVCDEKTFKFYFLLIYFSAFIFSFLSLLNGQTRFISFLFYVISFALPIFKTFYSTTIVSTHKVANSYVKTAVISNLVFLLGAIISCINLKTNIILLPAYFVTILCEFFSFILLTQISLKHIYNNTWCELFGKFSQKSVYRKSRKFVTVVSSILIISILSLSCHFTAIAVYSVVDNVISPNYKYIPREAYDKFDVCFADIEKTQQITKSNCSIYIPDGLGLSSNKEKHILYVNEDNTIKISISTTDAYEQPFDGTNILNSMFKDEPEVLVSVVEDVYNNATEKYNLSLPRNFYDFVVSEQAFNEKELNIFSRGDAIAYVFAKILYATSSPSLYEWYKIYENEDTQIEGVLSYHEREDDNNQITHCYLFQFQQTNSNESYSVFATFVDNEHNEETVYKIINSIDIK